LGKKFDNFREKVENKTIILSKYLKNIMREIERGLPTM